MKKVFLKITFILTIILFIGISIELFSPKILMNLYAKVFNSNAYRSSASEILEITYPLPITTFEPTNNESPTRTLLNNIYEPLVKTDENLKLIPGLALSWGRIDDLTWEFKLRPNIKFHNGKELKVEDVKESINRAINNDNSQIKNLMKNIHAIKEISDYKFQLTTIKKDSLLLNKLSLLFIVPSQVDEDLESKPIGTGAYKFIDKEKNINILGINNDYWGQKPFYENVKIIEETSKKQRIKELQDKQADISINVPPEIIAEIPEDYDIKFMPSLEVVFLAFNLTGNQTTDILLDNDIRKAILLSIDKEEIAKLTDGYAHPVNQFISNGIFGYNPDIKDLDYDIEQAKEIIKNKKFKQAPEVTLDLADGLDIFGQYLQKSLSEINIKLNINSISIEELEYKIANQQSDFYFFGWRSELGDASDFLQQVIHSRTEDLGYGKYNGGFENEEIDKKIEESEENFDEKKRLISLQEIMQLINDEYIGIPLIESEIIYAIKKNINWKQRIDGFVYASQVN